MQVHMPNKGGGMRGLAKTIVFFLAAFFLVSFPAHAKRWKIAFLVQEGVPSLSEHPVDGFKQGLNVNGLVENEDYKIVGKKIFAASQEGGKAAAAVTMKLLDKGVDLVVTVGTAPSVGAWKVLQRSSVPQIYMVVTDPLGSGLVESLDRPSGKNITGIRYVADPEQEMMLARRISPQGKVFCFVYLPSVAADMARLGQYKKIKDTHGFKIEYVDLSTPEKLQAYQARADVDVGTGWLGWSLLAQENPDIKSPAKIAVTTGAEESLGGWSVAGIIIDSFVVGQQAAVMAMKVMNGEEKISRIMPEDPKKTDILVNLPVAKAHGFQGELYNIMLEANNIQQVIKIPNKDDYMQPDSQEKEEPGAGKPR